MLGISNSLAPLNLLIAAIQLSVILICCGTKLRLSEGVRVHQPSLLPVPCVKVAGTKIALRRASQKKLEERTIISVVCQCSPFLSPKGKESYCHCHTLFSLAQNDQKQCNTEAEQNAVCHRMQNRTITCFICSLYCNLCKIFAKTLLWMCEVDRVLCMFIVKRQE